MVEAGQPLYQVDPDLHAAAVNEARANLQSAQATRDAAEQLVERYRPLAGMEAVSKQDLVNAIASARQARAAVAQARAALNTATTILAFGTIPAPLTGRIGRSLVTVGGLAISGQPTPLATIQQLDPIFVDVQQSVSEVVALRRAIAGKADQAVRTQARIILPDGSPHPHPGTIRFSEVLVDPSTGTVTLRILVPNPDGTLLPGMFVRAILSQSSEPAAYLVPQQALIRDATGQAKLWLISGQNKALATPIVTSRTEGSYWVVTHGVRRGDRIIVQGTGKLRPDMPVRPHAAKTPQPAGPANSDRAMRKTAP